jgi:hypothetical protein
MGGWEQSQDTLPKFQSGSSHQEDKDDPEAFRMFTRRNLLKKREVSDEEEHYRYSKTFNKK